jgi:hypothetical protein
MYLHFQQSVTMHFVFMGFHMVASVTAISLCSINELLSVMEKCCVIYEALTDS